MGRWMRRSPGWAADSAAEDAGGLASAAAVRTERWPAGHAAAVDLHSAVAGLEWCPLAAWLEFRRSSTAPYETPASPRSVAAVALPAVQKGGALAINRMALKANQGALDHFNEKRTYRFSLLVQYLFELFEMFQLDFDLRHLRIDQ